MSDICTIYYLYSETGVNIFLGIQNGHSLKPKICEFSNYESIKNTKWKKFGRGDYSGMK